MIYRYIYKITCTAGSFKGKFYFGKHTTDNLDDGYKGSGTKICKYYKKYPNDYVKEIIAFYNTDEELNKAEFDIIEPYLDTPMCLNMCSGGNVNHPTKELSKILSDSLKGKQAWNKGLKGVYKASEETKKKLSEAHKGKHYGGTVTEESRQKQSLSLKKFYETHDGPNKGKKFSDETKNKLSEKAKNRTHQPMQGKHHSEETKQKMSDAAKGKKRQPFSDEWKNKISESVSGQKNGMYGITGKDHPMYGKHHSEETKQKMREAWKRRKSILNKNIN